jgi:hypothetical protein
MKKILLLATVALLSFSVVNAASFQDGNKPKKECCTKCDKCKDGKCSKSDCSKTGDAKKDCCKKEKQS